VGQRYKMFLNYELYIFKFNQIDTLK
jgi:hypothetical protein